MGKYARRFKDRIRKGSNLANPPALGRAYVNRAESEKGRGERLEKERKGEREGDHERERKRKGAGEGRRGRGSILHGQRTISMHEAHWGYRFLSTQNTYLHFGLCTGVSC